MKINPKNILRKIIFLLCSIFVHLILLLLFYQAKLNLHYSLKAGLFNRRLPEIVVNMVAVPRPRVASLTAKRSSASPIPEATLKALPAKTGISAPVKQTAKPQINQASGIKENIKQLARLADQKTINRERVSIASLINRSEVAATSKISTLITKTQATTKTADSRNYASVSSSIARKKASLSFTTAKITAPEAASRRQSLSPEAAKKREHAAIITKPQTGRFIADKLTRPYHSNQSHRGKTASLVTALKSEGSKHLYKREINQADKKTTVPIKPGRMLSKPSIALQPARQKIAPQGIKAAISKEEYIAPDLMAENQYSGKPAHQFDHALSTGDHFKSIKLKHKIVDKTNVLKPAAEKQAPAQALLSAANHQLSTGVKQRIEVTPIKRDYKNRLYKSGASGVVSKNPTASLTGIIKRVSAIALYIDGQAGAGQAVTVDKPSYSVQGRVTPEVSQLFLKVNEDLTSVKVNQGNFQTEAKLRDGLNQIEMLAFSAAGQIVKQSISILYVPPAIQLEHKYKPSAWTTYINDKISANSYVYAIALDKYKNKWFAMNTGAVKYNGRRWVSYTTRDGLVSDKVYAIASDQKGHLWFGTEGGVSHFNRLKWTNYTTRDGLVNNRVNAVAADGQGRLWFGTDGGVSRFDGTNWENYTVKDGLVNNQVNAMLVDRQGYLWFGTDGGVSRFDGTNWENYTVKDGLVNNQVNAMLVDRQGYLWFGTNEGVSRFDGTNWENYTVKDGLVSNRVNTAAADEQNRLWFGTNEGVSRFDNGYWLSFNKQDGLPSDKIYAVLVESNYRKWFGTDIGISELNEEANSRVYR